MEFKSTYLIGICFIFLVLVVNVLFLLGKPLFWPITVLAVVVGVIPVWVDIGKENNRQKQIEVQFIDFMRNLAEAVKSGISIPKAIVLIAKKNFQELNPFLHKLANQIECGIPTQKALVTFSLDVDNVLVKRSVSIIVEAEQSGGDIRDILTSIVDSVVNVKKLKAERRASAYTQIVQGYIIFYVFILIMLLLQLWLFPKLLGLSENLGKGAGGGLLSFNAGTVPVNLDAIFLSLIIIQGFFAGIMIGKFSEGSIKQGLIHSFVLMGSAALIITTVTGVFR